ASRASTGSTREASALRRRQTGVEVQRGVTKRRHRPGLVTGHTRAWVRGASGRYGVPNCDKVVSEACALMPWNSGCGSLVVI
ncbi:MAG: hypothetical protein AAB403_08545, partial [Planctomycetota bacterium]